MKAKIKVLDTIIGRGGNKECWSIKDFPKQVALVSAYSYTDKDALAVLKKEHRELSKIRRAGIPALPARLMRVFNPHHKKEVWAMIAPRMERHTRGWDCENIEQWKSLYRIYAKMGESGLGIGDLQFLADKKRFLVADPLGVFKYTDPDTVKAYKKNMESYCKDIQIRIERFNELQKVAA